MKVLLGALFIWLAIGAVIGYGIFKMCVHGSPWLFIIALLAYIVVVARVGCKTH